jgi:hypothetical protein
MRRSVAAALAAAAVGALATAAAASIVLRVTPRELADTANLVVEGRVATVDIRWDDAHTCINHYVTVNVDRLHKGTAGGAVVVKVPGGRVGEEEVRVDGTAKFVPDEEVVLFLWKDAQGEWLVLGEAQGKFVLRRDAKSGVRMAENSLKGLCLVMRGRAKDAAGDSAKKADRLSYDDLIAVVKASVDAAAAPKPTTPINGDQPAVPAAPAPGATGGTGSTGSATGTGTGSQPAGQGPAPISTPDPPSTSTPPSGGAPPPTKDAPVPPTGNTGTAKDGQTPPPSPEAEKR